MSRLRASLVALVLTALPSTASAYCQTLTCAGECERDRDACPVGGHPVHWTKLPIVYRFHSRGSRLLVREEARAAIRASFHRWSDVVCPDGRRTSLRFREEEDTDVEKGLEPNDRPSQPFGIYFRDFGWPHKKRDATLALTTLDFSKKDGTVLYGDIEINSGAKRFAVTEDGDGIDLQAVMTHEVGHYIGLAHSTARGSIMAESHCEIGDGRCEKGKFAARRLADDDIEAVCDLYPPGAQNPPENAPPVSCSTAPEREAALSIGTSAVLVVISLAAALRRRLRSR